MWLKRRIENTLTVNVTALESTDGDWYRIKNH